MRTVKIKSGGTVNVYPDGMEWAKEGTCFSESEMNHALKISSSLRSDPEQQREFWKTLLEKKTSGKYSLFDDFAVETELTESARLAKKYAPLCKAALRGIKSEQV